jgi:threonyl-tRNA synthetase
VMIHRALMGSFERFIGILIEHYAGEFPLWLAPVQALVLPIADRHLDYAREEEEQLRAAGIRVAVDDRTESVGKKIRDGELKKVPYMLVVGDQEASDGTVAVRKHREGDLGTQPVSDFAASLSAAILARE